MTQFLAEEFRNAFSADHIIMFVRLIGAAIFGGLIGFEREIHRHPAGLRTHILVSMAAALFVLVAIEVPEIMRSDRDVLRVDPTRVVQSITEGVAFLAAGTIPELRACTDSAEAMHLFVDFRRNFGVPKIPPERFFSKRKGNFWSMSPSADLGRLAAIPFQD